MNLTIIKADNGYILGWDNEGVTRQLVFEENEEKPLEAFQQAMWQVIEHFGMYGSKHDNERIRVIIEKNFDDETEEHA